jgi:dTDP-4-amino-4,6-dideoxygalactose transaminase
VKNSSLYVTRPDLPALSEFLPYLEELWASRTLTNGGVMHERLESALCEHLGVEHISLFANGTLALTAMLRDANLCGEVITTPFTFVATAHALSLLGLRPVFVDLDPETGNLDPACVEAAITPRTSAILGVHVYGTPCRHEELQAIAQRHNLKLLYDAAHAFGVKAGGGSVLRYGEYAAVSFHATKAFTTAEGGALICSSAAAKARLDRYKNFGFIDEVTVASVGENGKLNELQAALGLAQLQHFGARLEERKQIASRYVEGLRSVDGIRCLIAPSGVESNYSYFPILVESVCGHTRDALYAQLRDAGVYARRYFYPLLTELEPYRSTHDVVRRALPVANSLAQQVLCLPIYASLSVEEQDHIVAVIREARRTMKAA